MKTLITLFATILFPLCALAQPNMKASDEHLAAIEKLSFLEGEWEGEGWSQMGPQKSFFTIHETGTPKLNGSIFVFEGLGHDKNTKNVIHNAFGIVAYDSQTGEYGMTAYRLDGGKVDADFAVMENGNIEWGFEVPQGKIKYIIENLDGKWHENGFINMGGGREFQFFEMTLTKK